MTLNSDAPTSESPEASPSVYVMSRTNIIGFLEARINTSDSLSVASYSFEMILVITISIFLLSRVENISLITAFVAGLIIAGLGAFILLVIDRTFSYRIGPTRKACVQLRRDILLQTEYVNTDEKATNEYLKTL